MSRIEIQTATIDAEGNLTLGFLKGGEPFYESVTGDNCPDAVRARASESFQRLSSPEGDQYRTVTKLMDRNVYRYFGSLRKAYRDWCKLQTWTVEVRDMRRGLWRGWTKGEMTAGSKDPG